MGKLMILGDKLRLALDLLQFFVATRPEGFRTAEPVTPLENPRGFSLARAGDVMRVKFGLSLFDLWKLASFAFTDRGSVQTILEATPSSQSVEFDLSLFNFVNPNCGSPSIFFNPFFHAIASGEITEEMLKEPAEASASTT